jgi:CubicO group peptidase (beta-lactamase class C family)
MPDASRSLPSQPSLRYLQLEARRRHAAGEFPALHDAQAAIAREHGAPTWAALRQLIDSPPPPDSPALDQLRWVIARFRDAGAAGWAPPAEAELREHFDDAFLAAEPAADLIALISGVAPVLRQDLTVVAQRPLEARVRVGTLQIAVAAADAPPHRLTGLLASPAAGPSADPRLAAPPPPRTAGDVPPPLAALAGETFGRLGAVALALAGGGAGQPGWAIAQGWADLDRGELLSTGHRLPATGVTATVTTTAVLRLVADGALGLDTRANDRLSAVRLADDTITVADLLAHTAGVDSPPIPDLFGDRATTLAALMGPVIGCDGPRGVLQPSNGGIAVLGELVAEITGLPYAEAVTRRVLEPLGLAGSSFPGRAADIGPGAATGYGLSGDGTLVPLPATVCALPAVAGLWAPAADLVRLGAGWASLLPPALARDALMPRTPAAPGAFRAGLGWLISPRGDVAMSAGASPGATASMLYRIRDGQVAVVMTTVFSPLDGVYDGVLRAWGAAA